MPLALLAMLGVAGLFAAWLRRAGGAEQRQAPVWLCGYQTLNGANSYTSSHIFRGLQELHVVDRRQCAKAPERVQGLRGV